MLIIDTHCDTLFMRALAPNDTPCVTLENLRKGGVNLQTCTLFAGSKSWMRWMRSRRRAGRSWILPLTRARAKAP